VFPSKRSQPEGGRVCMPSKTLAVKGGASLVPQTRDSHTPIWSLDVTLKSNILLLTITPDVANETP